MPTLRNRFVANKAQSMMTQIGQENPAIGRLNMLTFQEPGNWYAETYPAGETMSPFPNRNAIGLRPMGQQLPDPDIKNLLGGEALHILGGTNPQGQPTDAGWFGLKQRFLIRLPRNN